MNQSHDLIHRKLNRLAAFQLASASILLMIVAIVAILQSGQVRQLSGQLVALEHRLADLESRPIASIGASPVSDSEAAPPAPASPVISPAASRERAQRVSAVSAELVSLSGRASRGEELNADNLSELLEQLVNLAPEPGELGPEASAAAAHLWLLAGEFEAAVRWGTAALEEGADPAVAYVLAKAHVQLGDALEALRYAIKATSSEAAPPEAFLLRGRLELRAGLIEDARSSLRRALSHDAAAADAAVWLAGSLFEEGAYAEAVQVVERGLTVEPQRRELLRYQALLHLSRREYEECLRVSAKLLEEDQGDVGMVRALGEALLARGDLKVAVGTFERLVELEPERARGYELLGLALLASLEPAKAADAFAHATELDPSVASAWYHLGVALANGDNCEAALEAFDASIKLVEGQADAHFARAVCLARLDDDSEAELALMRALALDAALMAKVEAVGVFKGLLTGKAPVGRTDERGGGESPG